MLHRALRHRRGASHSLWPGRHPPSYRVGRAGVARPLPGAIRSPLRANRAGSARLRRGGRANSTVGTNRQPQGAEVKGTRAQARAVPRSRRPGWRICACICRSPLRWGPLGPAGFRPYSQSRLTVSRNSPGPRPKRFWGCGPRGGELPQVRDGRSQLRLGPAEGPNGLRTHTGRTHTGRARTRARFGSRPAQRLFQSSNSGSKRTPERSDTACASDCCASATACTHPDLVANVNGGPSGSLAGQPVPTVEP